MSTYSLSPRSLISFLLFSIAKTLSMLSWTVVSSEVGPGPDSTVWEPASLSVVVGASVVSSVGVTDMSDKLVNLSAFFKPLL